MSTKKKSDKPAKDVAKLYEMVLAEEKRLRLWLSHIAHDFPDTEFSAIARKALAGQEAPPHPLPISEPIPE